MGKLDVSCMRHMQKDDFRVLTAVEMGMRNHAVVPVELIVSIAGLRHGGATRFLSTLLRYKLVHHDNSNRYDGYRLTWNGYDVLALRTLLQVTRASLRGTLRAAAAGEGGVKVVKVVKGG